MSASRPRAFRLSHSLGDALDLRAKELGYRSATALIEALARYDCLCRSSHGVTTQWAKLSGVEQDQLDEKLLERTMRGDGMTAADAKQVDWRTL